MKTPITDNAWDMAWDKGECAPEVLSECSRRLEQDREIFRQALIKIYTSPLTEASETILQALRDASAFPGEMHEP